MKSKEERYRSAAERNLNNFRSRLKLRTVAGKQAKESLSSCKDDALLLAKKLGIRTSDAHMMAEVNAILVEAKKAEDKKAKKEAKP